MGSRVRIAAAACLVASGLLAGGAGGALAFADPLLDVGDNAPGDGDRRTSADPAEDDGIHPRPDTNTGGEAPGKKPADPQEPDLEKPDDQKPDEEGRGDNGNGLGENPGNGNCGNDGSNGNAQGCGSGGSGEEETPPTTRPSPTPTTNVPPPTEVPPPEEEPGECEDNSDDDCGPGWPWWPWPWPWEPGEPPVSGGGGGGGAVEPPSGRPEAPPAMQIPEHVGVDPGEPPVPGVGVAAAELPIPPITLPVIVTPPAAPGGAGAGPSAPTQSLPGAPRAVTPEPPAVRELPPTNVGSNVAVPASTYRIGYADYLRSAGISQLAALAVPGVAGMLILTGAGGWVGYRQAKAGHAVRTGGTARFVN